MWKELVFFKLTYEMCIWSDVDFENISLRVQRFVCEDISSELLYRVMYYRSSRYCKFICSFLKFIVWYFWLVDILVFWKSNFVNNVKNVFIFLKIYKY